MNYKLARDTFAKARKNRSGGVNLQRNTYLERIERNVYSPTGKTFDNLKPWYVIRLHDTNIVIFTPTYIELQSGGWHTKTTMDRMYNNVPFGISASKAGWSVALVTDDVDCYCTYGSDAKIGCKRHFTGKWTGEPYGDDSSPIWEWIECQDCHGTGKRTGIDWRESHPYFDGIRVSNDGRRLLKGQPNKPKHFYPVVTQSGW